jgi:NTP pyrophosphatase (non-canonical NTP hydrolase)
MPEIAALQQAIRDFVAERDWEQFHNPKNLVMALTAEVGELVELFQWLSAEQAELVMDEAGSALRIREELADVFIYLLRLADALDADLAEAVLRKLDLNAQKYPIELASGSATKSTDLASGQEVASNTALAAFKNPARLVSRREFYSKPCPVPESSGIYGWWFDQLPGAFEVERCETYHGSYLLYIGICPKQPPKSGQAPNKRTLRDRIREHFGLNAEGSTLRLTLGCLLADELDLQLRRVGSGKRFTFAHDGETQLSGWMSQHARVSWWVTEQPWAVESQLISSLDLPLNLDQNKHNVFHEHLTQLRKGAKASARNLPIVS